MDFPLILFYAFGFVLLGSALLVVMVRNPVHAALFLVLAFFTAAGLWLLLYAEFLAIVLVLVYVGAVMVLFLFVVMMLDINIDLLREGFWKNAPLAAIVGIVMAGEMVALLPRGTRGSGPAAGAAPAAGFFHTNAAGAGLVNGYGLSLLAASAVLPGGNLAALAHTLPPRHMA